MLGSLVALALTRGTLTRTAMSASGEDTFGPRASGSTEASADLRPRLGAERDRVAGIACSTDAKAKQAMIKRPARDDTTFAPWRTEGDRKRRPGHHVGAGARAPAGPGRSDTELTVPQRHREHAFAPAQEPVGAIDVTSTRAGGEERLLRPPDPVDAVEGARALLGGGRRRARRTGATCRDRKRRARRRPLELPDLRDERLRLRVELEAGVDGPERPPKRGQLIRGRAGETGTRLAQLCGELCVVVEHARRARGGIGCRVPQPALLGLRQLREATGVRKESLGSRQEVDVGRHVRRAVLPRVALVDAEVVSKPCTW